MTRAALVVLALGAVVAVLWMVVPQDRRYMLYGIAGIALVMGIITGVESWWRRRLPPNE